MACTFSDTSTRWFFPVWTCSVGLKVTVRNCEWVDLYGRYSDVVILRIQWNMVGLRADIIVCQRIYKTFMHLNMRVMICCSAKHDHTSSIYIIQNNSNMKTWKLQPDYIYIYILTWGKCVLLSQPPSESFFNIFYYTNRNMLIRITWSWTLKHILLKQSKHVDMHHMITQVEGLIIMLSLPAIQKYSG